MENQTVTHQMDMVKRECMKGMLAQGGALKGTEAEVQHAMKGKVTGTELVPMTAPGGEDIHLPSTVTRSYISSRLYCTF